jgi:hypothetical protein
MRDRVNRTSLLAGVAANANFRVNQVLLDHFGRNNFGHGKSSVLSLFTASGCAVAGCARLTV